MFLSWLPLAEIIFINSDWTLHSLEPLHASRQLPGGRTEKGFVFTKNIECLSN